MFLFKYACPASSFSKLILINALADKLWLGLSQWKPAQRIMTPYCSKVWVFLVFVFHLHRICSVAAPNIGQVLVYTHLLNLFPSWHLCFAKKIHLFKSVSFLQHGGECTADLCRADKHHNAHMTSHELYVLKGCWHVNTQSLSISHEGCHSGRFLLVKSGAL